jgi:uncharacterized membrane protein
MSNETGYVLYTVLPALAVTSYAIYLAYIVTDHTRLEKKLARYKGTPSYRLYQKVYNRHFLYSWSCLALLFIFGVVYGYYKSTVNELSVGFSLSALLINVSLLSISGFFLVKALKK